ncbi:hypothetical protein [Fodinibius saliphilus]|uniref:hypothetical protein n=1 Tax=Fodinibius saliphilus TaxID=1920650 RepID=UPI001109242D|nr:hypothetical protein [Fodinibius saliphilus]
MKNILGTFLLFLCFIQNNVELPAAHEFNTNCETSFKMQNEESTAQLKFNSSDGNLIIYCEIKNVSAGKYKLLLADFKVDSSVTAKQVNNENSQEVLEIIVKKDKGRTVRQDQSRQCKDVKKFKYRALIVKQRDANKDVVFHN